MRCLRTKNSLYLQSPILAGLGRARSRCTCGRAERTPGAMCHSQSTCPPTHGDAPVPREGCKPQCGADCLYLRSHSIASGLENTVTQYIVNSLPACGNANTPFPMRCKMQDAACSVRPQQSTARNIQQRRSVGPTRSAALPATPDRGATCSVHHARWYNMQRASCSVHHAACSVHATCSVHHTTAPFGPVPHALCSVAPTASFRHSTLHRSGAVAAQRVDPTERRLVSVARCIC
jgi:hypothetical protein